jgi:low temperature requirement protein LtrA
LFTIIVLAESILGTVAGIAEIKDMHPAAWVAFISGILIAFLLWSLYFDMTSEQETKEGYGYMQWLIFLHFPLLASLSVVGACIKVLIIDMEAGNHLTVQWMFCVSVATILFMIVGITKIMKEEEEDRSYIRPVPFIRKLSEHSCFLVHHCGNIIYSCFYWHQELGTF